MQAVRGLGDKYAHQTSDRNEGMGHAAGVELIKARWNAIPGIRAEAFVRLPHHVTEDEFSNVIYDVVAFKPGDNSVVATIEVETQTNDTTHIARDASKLANAPGESIWCVPNKACQNQLLRSMVREGVLTPDENDPGFPHALSSTFANNRIKDLVIDGKYRMPGESFPVSKICTYNDVRQKIQRFAPDVLSVQAAEIGGGR